MSRPSVLHICNTFFEAELENPDFFPTTRMSVERETREIPNKAITASPNQQVLASWMRSHPIVQKLQTLPLYYAGDEDLVLVSDLPEFPDHRLRLLGAPLQAKTIESWGASKSIAAWAEEENLSYSMPDWETVRTVNSKIFSFCHSPILPFAALLQNEQEALEWIEKTPGRKVLKTAFGTAGRGHFHLPSKRNLSSFLKKEFVKNVPLIGEPWVERVLDFSTQWKDSVLLGATIFENTPEGTYRATIAGARPQIFGSYDWALEEHLAIVQPILKKIRQLGFFGNLGIDAYVYRWKNKELLQPIVEINARKTMSWIALQIQEKKYPGRDLRFSFSPKKGIFFETMY